MVGMDERYVVWAEGRPHDTRTTSSWLRAQWWLIFRLGLPAFFRGERMCLQSFDHAPGRLHVRRRRF